MSPALGLHRTMPPLAHEHVFSDTREERVAAVTPGTPTLPCAKGPRETPPPNQSPDDPGGSERFFGDINQESEGRQRPLLGRAGEESCAQGTFTSSRRQNPGCSSYGSEPRTSAERARPVLVLPPQVTLRTCSSGPDDNQERRAGEAPRSLAA